MSHGINVKPFPTIFWLCCPKLKNRISNEVRKLLVIKNNIKLTMGCNATWINRETDELKTITQTVKQQL